MNENDVDNIFNNEDEYNKKIINDLIKHYNELESVTLNKDICISNFSNFITQVINNYVYNFYDNSEFIRSGILEQIKNTFTFDDFNKVNEINIEKKRQRND